MSLWPEIEMFLHIFLSERESKGMHCIFNSYLLENNGGSESLYVFTCTYIMKLWTD